MSGQAYVRDPNAPLTDLSASRIKTVDRCGRAFKYQYIDHIPAATESAAMMFGNVVHDGVDRWYDTKEHKTTALGPIFEALWEAYLPKPIWAATKRCLEANSELDAVAEAIKISRPDLKAPRQTKAFQESSAFKTFEDLRDAMNKKCDALEEVRWPKDENPLQAFQKSLVIAKQLEARWAPLPAPIVVEHPFLLEFEGYTIKGRIDQIRHDPTKHGEPGPYELYDIKTGRKPLTQMEAFIQAFLYAEACRQLPELPTPDTVVFWLARHDRPQRGRINYESHKELALTILNGVARRIITGAYEPHFGMWCERCDFASICEAEIGLWPVGEDTLALETA